MLQYSKPNGKMRLLQGYSPGRLVHDCEPLQMTWLRDLAEESECSGSQPAVADVPTIADEVDSQLTQANGLGT
jgi:hypothetical protein